MGKVPMPNEFDSLFFSCSKLQPLTREYWFFHLNSVEPKKSRQLVFSLYRSGMKTKINGLDLDNRFGLVLWLFDRKKSLVFEEITDAKFSDNSISNSNFVFKGSFPHYSFQFSDGDKFSRIKFSVPNQRGYNIWNPSLGPFALKVFNLYPHFEGILNGRKVSGKGYVQKVILNFPLFPWKWGNLHFSEGSSLDYFIPYFNLAGGNLNLRSSIKFIHSSGTVFDFNDAMIDMSGDTWAITGAKGKLRLEVEPYSNSLFRFETKGKFDYNQYFVDVGEFSFENNGNEITLDDLGYGGGLVEHAHGFTW